MDNVWGKGADLTNATVRQARYNEARRNIRQNLQRLSRKSTPNRPALVTVPPVTRDTSTMWRGET